MYRSVSTSIWADDAILSMSPEQKLLFLYLHTNPYASACGIYKMQLRTMGFQLGLMHTPFESALRGLCAAFPDFVAADWQTGEVALLQYPRQVLISATGRALAVVAKEIEGVGSQYLLRELIARNSATINKPYLEQLRRLQMRAINEGKASLTVADYRVVEFTPNFHGDLSQGSDNQQDDRKRESKVNESKLSLPTREEEIESFENPNPIVWGNGTEVRLQKAQATLKAYFEKFPGRWKEIADQARNECGESQFFDELDAWIRRHADNLMITQDPVKALTSGQNLFISWLSKPWCREQYKTNGNDSPTQRNGRVQQQRKDNSFPSSEELRRKYGVL